MLAVIALLRLVELADCDMPEYHIVQPNAGAVEIRFWETRGVEALDLVDHQSPTDEKVC